MDIVGPICMGSSVMTHWQPIETAPRDGPILVWFDHDADTYHEDDGKLTDYACHAEGGDFYSGKGCVIAEWCDGWHEGDGFEEPCYWMPGCWLVQFNGDNSDYVCNATHWMPLPDAPAKE